MRPRRREKHASEPARTGEMLAVDSERPPGMRKTLRLVQPAMGCNHDRRATACQTLSLRRPCSEALKLVKAVGAVA